MALFDTILSRLLDQQTDGQNWEDLVRFIVEFFDDAVQASIDLQTLTWLGSASGWWLDRIGWIVGVTRPPEEETERIFRCDHPSFPAYDPLHGWGDSSNPALGGLIWGRTNGLPTGQQADDEDYYEYINAKILATYGDPGPDASLPGIARYIQAAFGVGSVVTQDATTRTIFVELTGSVDLRQRRYIEKFTPVMAGCSMVITNWTV